MSRKYFGTDGIRGKANENPMDAQTILRVGMAAGAYFSKDPKRSHRVVIGKDTRLSGYLLEPALTSGFISMGMNVTLVGPIPTPAISMLTRSLRADMGVMISASHNAYHDNGIKFFDGRGNKLSDEVEQEIEAMMEGDLTSYLAPSDKLGRAHRLDDAQGRYIEYVKATFPRRCRLDGLKIVIDCANGAGYKLGPTILWELGAEVVILANKPDGFNINKACGSMHPESIQEAVLEHGADLGIALDGDADRVILCDEKGQLIDGDQLMGAIALYFKERDVLSGNALVATVMSNIGLEKMLKNNGIELIRANVGDRYVIEKMREGGYNLGGEQSGHIIFGDYTTTGDGILAALQALAILVTHQKPASELLHSFTPYPQTLKNVSYNKNGKDPLDKLSVQEAIKSGEDTLGDGGRVLIRKSGTEPLIRVMTESEDTKLTEQVANTIIEAIKSS